ncbi:hypothetical protein SAMN05216413_1427 [Ruminococcaceae bacterium KH2T8]|nr:hypothetical protein SAMN05216413_1427 [Ruminococcaceae bacterium KH2T8]
MGLFRKYVNQTRKPVGFLGEMMVNGMNGGHAKMAVWASQHSFAVSAGCRKDAGEASAWGIRSIRVRNDCNCAIWLCRTLIISSLLTA